MQRPLFNFLFAAAFLLLITVVWRSEVDANLVAYWSFDNSKQVMANQSSNKFETVNHRATVVKGRKGNALSFNGKEFLKVNYSPVSDRFQNGIDLVQFF